MEALVLPVLSVIDIVSVLSYKRTDRVPFALGGHDIPFKDTPGDLCTTIGGPEWMANSSLLPFSLPVMSGPGIWLQSSSREVCFL